MKKFPVLLLAILLGVSLSARAQTAEVTVQLNEQFFDVLLDALFQNGGSPEFPISELEEQ